MTTTSSYPVHCGTPQGLPLPPVLYTLYLAEQMQQDITHRFGYAEDICLYRTASTLDSCNELIPNDIPQINSWSCNNKIAFAPEKMEMIHLTRQGDGYSPVCVVDNSLTITPISPDAAEPALRWRGVWFDRKLNFRKHVAIRAAKARKVAAHIRSLTKTNCDPPAYSLRKAMITRVLPRLLYGSEARYGGRKRYHTTVRGTKGIDTRLGWHVDTVDKTLALAARGVLPVYRTTPTAVLVREAGLPSGNVALENAKLRFAVHLQTVDCSHPLAQRIERQTIRRGTGAGKPQQPQTKVQRHGCLLRPVPRPLPVPPHYTPGCRVDPKEGLEKKEGAERFKLWWQHLPPPLP